MTDQPTGRVDLNDFVAPETWPAFDDWAAGFEAGRPTPSAVLDGRTITLHAADGGTTTHAFPAAGAEVLEIAPGVVLVDRLVGDPESRDVVDESLVLDLQSGRGSVVRSWLVEVDGAIRGRSGIEPVGVDRPLAETGAFPRSDELVGRRALWTYSDDHAYEHIYLNRGTYAWHCLAGPEEGIADVDRTETYAIREDLYLFFLTETVMPTEGLMLLSFDPAAVRNVGRFFGWDPEPAQLSHTTFGARGIVLNETRYPRS